MARRTTTVTGLMIKPSTLTEGKTLTDSDSGRTFFLNAAGGFTVTLPRPRGGINFTFICKASPTTAYIIASNGASNVISGQVFVADTNAEDDSSVQAPGVNNVTFVADYAKVGDVIEMTSDGTYWYLRGFCGLQQAITMLNDSASPSASPSISVSASPSASLSRSPSVSPSISPSAS